MFIRNNELKETIQIKNKNAKFNREETINTLKTFLKDNGYNKDSIINGKQLRKILKKLGLCGDGVMINHFGSIQNLAKEVGFIYLGNQPYSTKEDAIRCIKEFFNKHNNKVTKIFLDKNIKNVGTWNCDTLRKKFGSFDNLAKKAGVEFIYNKHGGGIGKNEKLILDDIEKKRGIKIERQYQVGKFKLDGYYIEGNEAFEIDGVCHNEKKVKTLDLIREEIIKEMIGCFFTRINEKEYLKNMKVTKTIYDF